jgi:chemotaxis protein MotB
MIKRVKKVDESEDSHDEESWLLTYADTITNLMGFFALLLAISVIDKNKFNAMRNNVQEQLTNEEYQSNMDQLKNQLDSVFQKQTAAGVIDIDMDRSGISMVAKNASFFASGEAELLPQGRNIVGQVTNKVRKIKDNFNIEVEGHTDDDPISSDKYPTNWELSASRASNVVKFMIDQGLKPGSLKASAYGETRPLKPNKNKDGSKNIANMAENRRIVVKIYYSN